MEKKYVIKTEDNREINISLKPITLKQELAIVRLFTDLEIQKPEDLLNISMKDFLNTLISEEKIYDLFSIILTGSFEKSDLGDLTHDQIEQIVEDFFLINEKLKKRLKNLFAEIGSALKIMAATYLHSQQKDSSSPSAKETSQKEKK